MIGGIIEQECLPKNYSHDYEAVPDMPEAAKGHRFVLKDEDTFGAYGRGLDIHMHNQSEQGVYHKGCRYLSGWIVTMMDKAPIHLKTFHSLSSGELVTHLSGNEFSLEDKYFPPGSFFGVRSVAIVNNYVHEKMEITNYNADVLPLKVRYKFQADFSDMFEVRGIPRLKRGTIENIKLDPLGVTLPYQGLDGVKRTTKIEWSEEPHFSKENEVIFRTNLKPGQSWTLNLGITCLEGDQQIDLKDRECSFLEVRNKREKYFKDSCSVKTDSELFNRWLKHSSDDLRILTTQTSEGIYPMAGLPWFSAIFGRDSLITALETLWHKPDLARGVLKNLAFLQGDKVDESSDQEPGKIIHERRSGEMANLKEVPFGSYYGSVDTTPLFVILAKKYIELTADSQFLCEIWQNLMSCANWLENFGDVDQDLFIEYRRSEKGLLDQGWKDSPGAIVHKDGQLAPGPIALVEAQAYAYQAFRCLGWLARMKGELVLSNTYETKSKKIQEAFNEKFWWSEQKFYYIALDGDKQPCKVVSSNPGHCLWMNCADMDKGKQVVRRLMSEEFFSGWGIRTLSSKMSFYHPISYHNGSVWPHDTALAAAGFCRYGAKDQAAEVFEGLFQAALTFPHERLPELFCGFDKSLGVGPTPFPGACSPQAWTTGIPYLMLNALLGIKVDGVANKLVLRKPVLPLSVNKVMFENLKVGDASVSFTLHRHKDSVALSVQSINGNVEILIQPEET